MARTKLHQPVRLKSGEIATVADLDAEGRVRYDVIENVTTKGGGLRTAYLADLIEIDGSVGGCVEVSKFAYDYRAKEKVRSSTAS